MTYLNTYITVPITFRQERWTLRCRPAECKQLFIVARIRVQVLMFVLFVRRAPFLSAHEVLLGQQTNWELIACHLAQSAR